MEKSYKAYVKKVITNMFHTIVHRIILLNNCFNS